MENNISKIYFIPGDLVILKHDLDNKPIMLVTEVVTSKILNPSCRSEERRVGKECRL